MADDRYYSNTDEAQRFQPGTTAEAGQVDQKFDEVTAGFQGVAVDTDRSLKLPSVSGASQEIDATPLQRRRRVVGFDADGNLTLLTGFNWRGDWTTATEYFVNDVFRDPVTKNIYVTIIRHTSAAALSTDITAGRVELAISVEEVEAAKAAAEAARNLSMQYRDESRAARDASQTAQGLSETARNKSQAWAETLENTEVEPGQYSSLHHKAKSQQAQALSEQARNASQTARDASQAAQTASERARDLSRQYRDTAEQHRNNAQAARGKAQQWAEAEGEVEPGSDSAKTWAGRAAQAVSEGVIDDGRTVNDFTWSSQKISSELQAQKTRAVTQSLAAPPEIRDIDTWSIDATAVSRHSGGSVASFEVTWWDGAAETVAASGGAATLSRAVDQPVGGVVSAAVRALDDIGNASAPETVTADVVANRVPEGPVVISAPTQTGKNSTFQVSFSGATDPDGDSISYTVTDTGAFTFAKTSGIADGEIVEVTAPDVTDDIAITFSVKAVDSLGASTATYSETVTVLAAQVIGVALRATGSGGTFDHIDESGATIATPSTAWFNGHPVFGGMQDVSVDGQVMVEVPRFWYKRGTVGGDPAWWVSDQPLTGFTIMPAFVLDGVEVSSFQVGKYQASLSGGKLQSVSGVSPVVSRSLTQFLADAEARNVSGVAGFRLWHYDMWLAIQWLYLVENATMDSQTKTGEGRVNEPSAAAVDATDVAQATYRGIVGLWGNVYQWMDGARTLSSVLERRDYNGAWESTGESVPNAGAATYPITFRNSAPLEFIPDTYSTSNDSTATLPDYVRWRDAGEYYPIVGGHWSNAANAGLWSVLCYYAASYSAAIIGARLARVVS